MSDGKVRVPVCGFRLAIAGCAAAIALMATAWAIYPGGYDWLNRDLSTLGRVFTVNGLGHHVNFPVYNFGLLVWGMSSLAFFIGAAMQAATPRAARRMLIAGVMTGLGLTGIGITPADVPNNLWHVVSSSTAILGFAIAVFATSREEQPGKRFWVWSLAATAVLYLLLRICRIPHGSEIFQKLFVLYVYSYVIFQSLARLQRLRRRPGTVAQAVLPELYRAGRVAVWGGVGAMLLLIVVAILVYPEGFDWHNHWTSRLGNVFLTDARKTKQDIYPYYMIYDYALAVGGCGLVAFWALRSLRAHDRGFGVALLLIGWLSGCALAGIGLAPTSALGLHRLSIDLFSLSVFALLFLQLFPRAGSGERPAVRWSWFILIIGSVLLFQWLGSPWGKVAQKALILEISVWLIAQGWDLRSQRQ